MARMILIEESELDRLRDEMLKDAKLFKLENDIPGSETPTFRTFNYYVHQFVDAIKKAPSHD